MSPTIPNQIRVSDSTRWQEIDVASLVSFDPNGSDDDASDSSSSDSDDSSSFSTGSSSSGSRWDIEVNIVADCSSPRVPQRRMSSVAANCAKLVGDIPRIPRRRATLIFITGKSKGFVDGNEKPLPLINDAIMKSATMDLPPMLPQRSPRRTPAGAGSTVLSLSPQKMKTMMPPARPGRKSSAEVQTARPARAATASFDDICKQFPDRKCNCPHSLRARGVSIKRQQPRQKSATAA